MIKPIKQNLAFRAQVPQVFQNVAQSRPAVPAPSQSDLPKKGFKDTVRSSKKGFLNFLKGFNNVTNTTSGAVRGICEGVAAGVLIGTVGRNFIKSKEIISRNIEQTAADVAQAAKNFPVGKLILKTIGSSIKDIFGVAKKALVNLYEQSPKENLKGLIKNNLVKRFANYVGNKKLMAFASIVGLGITAFRIAQGKIAANKKNSDLDHALNEGHVSTK